MDENGLPGTGLITSNNFNSRKYRSRIKAGLPCEITSVWRLFRDVKRGSFSRGLECTNIQNVRPRADFYSRVISLEILLLLDE